MKKILKIVLALALAFSGIVVGQVNNVYASNENISAYPQDVYKRQQIGIVEIKF